MTITLSLTVSVERKPTAPSMQGHSVETGKSGEPRIMVFLKACRPFLWRWVELFGKI
jgi:hypothetical protein